MSLKNSFEGVSRTLELFSLLIVLFLGYVGFSMVLPIFPSLLLSQDSSSFLPLHYSSEFRYIALGCLIGIYPLGQLIGGPILGKLSDTYGRRPLLVISLVAAAPAYILSGIAIYTKSFALLYISRFICGIFEGNVVIATSSIADISGDRSMRTQRFGFLLAASSIGFVVGPTLSGTVGNYTLLGHSGVDMPFYLAGVLVMFALCIVSMFYKETLSEENRSPFIPKEIHVEILKPLTSKKLQPLYISNFFLYLAFFLFFVFLPMFLIKKFHYTEDSLSSLITYLALFIFIAPLSYGFIARFMQSKTIVIAIGLIFSLCVGSVATFSSPYLLFITLIIPGWCIAAGFTFSTSIVSDVASQKAQGAVLGTNQSILLLSEVLATFVGGLLAAQYIHLPLYMAQFSAVVSSLILLYHEVRAK